MGFKGAMAGGGAALGDMGRNMFQSAMEEERAMRIEEHRMSAERGRYVQEAGPSGAIVQRDTLTNRAEILPSGKSPGGLKQIMTPEGPRWVREDDAIGQAPVTRQGMNVTLPDGTTMSMGGVDGGYKVPMGFRYRDPANPATGVEPVPGGPGDTMSAGDAAKTQMLQQGISDVDAFAGMLIRPNGAIDRELLVTMTGKVPGTAGRMAYSKVFNAIEARLRAESGAAVPDTEVKRMADRFVPSPFDNDATIRDKVQRLREFLAGALNKVDPSGRFNRRGQMSGDVSAMSDDDLLKMLGVQ
jgi:hypothetical protein